MLQVKSAFKKQTKTFDRFLAEIIKIIFNNVF